MPSRAFIDSDLSGPGADVATGRCVLMPSRAFIDSDVRAAITKIRAAKIVLMPSRAFIDSDEGKKPGDKVVVFSLNALTGIY